MEKDFYLNLIAKEIDGSLSQDETEKLLYWRNLDRSNEAQYIETIDAWEKSAHAFVEDSIPLVDVSGDFDQLQVRIAKELTPLETENRSWNWNWAAAAAILLIGFAWVWNMETGQDMHWQSLTTQESKSEVVLADGTKVTIDVDSHLSFPERFEGDKRLVKLDGRAYFEVTKDPAKPFIIEGAQESIKVLGTSFDFETRGSASQSKVNVRTGRVLFFENKKEAEQQVVLTAGSSAIFDRSKHEIETGYVGLNDLNWQRPALVFENHPLDKVLGAIAKAYAVKIDCKVPITEACDFTSNFDGLPLAEVLETVAIVFDLEIKKLTETHFELLGDGC